MLNPAVDACRIIGETVKVLYSGSNISMKDVKRTTGLLNRLTADEVNMTTSIEQARVRSFRIYADILLCRPFFLLQFTASTDELQTLDSIEPQINELSRRCVSESCRAVDMLTLSMRSTSPPHIDPFTP